MKVLAMVIIITELGRVACARDQWQSLSVGTEGLPVIKDALCVCIFIFYLL